MACPHAAHLTSLGVAQSHVDAAHADLIAQGFDPSAIFAFISAIIAAMKNNPQAVQLGKVILNALGQAVPSLAPIISVLLSLFP